MIYALVVAMCLVAAVPARAFVTSPNTAFRSTQLFSSVEERTIKSISAPDFYWQFRLERLSNKKGGDLPFSAANYPDVSSNKDLYDAYYLDLTLQGKLDGFDWEAEKNINDSEWQSIYKNICKWSSDTSKSNRPDTSNLPENDFDLLKQFYPQISFRDLDQPFAAEEVGANFKYGSMKDMLQAALDGTLDVPGYSNDIVNLDAGKAKAALASLKESTMGKLDAIQKDTMAYAMAPFPDDQAKQHYATLKTKLADFPQGAAGWTDFRKKMEAEVDEMAKLASKPFDPHHHGEGDCVSPAEEFKAKYGRDLDEMQERMNAYKSDPKAFLENAIIQNFGQNGLDVWKKSEGFSMSDSEKASAEKAFADFIAKA